MMRVFLLVIFTSLITACTSVSTYEDEVYEDEGISSKSKKLIPNQMMLAKNSYYGGYYKEAEYYFNGIIEADSSSYDDIDIAVAYWLASLGRLGQLDTLRDYIDMNTIETDINVPGGMDLDLGFDVGDPRLWQCFHESSTEKEIECWVDHGELSIAKSLIIKGVIADHQESRVIR